MAMFHLYLTYKNKMNLFEFFIAIHVLFTVLAIASGFTALLSTPKGSDFHKKCGKFYCVSYAGAILLGILMMFIKYKTLFFSFTLLSIYLLGNAYVSIRYPNKNTTWNRILFLCLLGALGVYSYDAIQLYPELYTDEFGWALIRYFFLIFSIVLIIRDVQYQKKTHLLPLDFLHRHMEFTTLSLIPLIGGVMLRFSDYWMDHDWRWTWWITPFAIGYPLIILWINHYRKRPEILLQKIKLPTSNTQP